MLEANIYLNLINPYVPGKPIDEVKREMGLDDVVKLASNENNRGIPARVIKKLESKIKELFLYPDGSLFALRKALCEKLGVSGEQLVFGNGSDELLQLIALAYLGEDKEALISEGTFSEYEFCARIINAPFRKVPLKNYTYDLEAFSRAISIDTRVVFLCNPNNPTGTYFSKDALTDFMKNVPANVLVVMDEAYYEYAKGDDYPESLELLSQYNNMLILRTFSKVYALAGLRLGYGIASAEVVSTLNRVRQPFNVNAFAQEAALAMLAEKTWEEEVREEVEVCKKYLYDELDKLGVEYLRSRSNFVFIFTDLPAKQVFELLLAKGIIVRPMNGFGFPNAIRVSIGLKPENKKFIKAIKEILS